MPQPELETFVGYAVKRLHLTLTGAIDAALAEHGLTATQFGALSVIAGAEGVTAAELATEIGISDQAASTLVARLVARGHVDRMAHPVDGRRRVLMLTAGGSRTLHRARAIVAAREDELLGDLTAKERATLRTLAVRALGSADRRSR